ncbi:MAG: YhdH/YhfP family quinone oxidoreductase [Bacteroidales bacterium]
MNTYKAYRTREAEGEYLSEVKEISFDDLPCNDVLIKVAYSGINYKDLLSVKGNKGVTKSYPHTAGIDAAGTVVNDKSGQFMNGEEVVVMGYDLGMNTDGGFAEYISVPSDWVLRKPHKFTLKQTMEIGTSGFTAALGISKMIQMGAKPENGPMIVTGATGGVGVYAVQILSAMGFDVWAVTGKKESEELLYTLGAQSVLSREEINVAKEKPLVRPRWAGGLDTVGGDTLVNLLKQCKKSGSVATCGNVGGMELNMTVLPFILNGINLLGINAADTPMDHRIKVWRLLEKYAKPNIVSKSGKEIALDEIAKAIDSMSNSSHTGRFLIKL